MRGRMFVESMRERMNEYRIGREYMNKNSRLWENIKYEYVREGICDKKKEIKKRSV